MILCPLLPAFFSKFPIILWNIVLALSLCHLSFLFPCPFFLFLLYCRRARIVFMIFFPHQAIFIPPPPGGGYFPKYRPLLPRQINLTWGRILGRNWDKSLKRFPSCYSPSSLLTDFPPPPPPTPFSQSGLKLVCNVNIVYGNLKFGNSQDYAPKSQRNCTYVNSAAELLSTTQRKRRHQGRKFAGENRDADPGLSGRIRVLVKYRCHETLTQFSETNTVHKISFAPVLHIRESVPLTVPYRTRIRTSD